MATMLWLTNSTVRPSRATSLILPEALLLERGVADREHLVDEQNLGLEMRGDRERESHVHAARVALDRGVEEALDLGERDDLVESALDLGAPHAEDRAVEVDVLAAGELGVKAGADLEQRADTARETARPSVGSVIRDEDLQQRALAGAVAADDADHLAFLTPRRTRP